MRLLLRLIRTLLYLALVGVVLGVGAAIALYYYLAPQLPDIASLAEVQLQVPLRVYSQDSKLIAQFGEKRRIPITYAEVPAAMEQAFLASEDDRFYQHPGVDYQGLLRAGFQLLRTGKRTQGGSTITMQVARNFFLSREKTYTRKLNEILLALKIERKLSKQQILELYLNKIYLGQRAYGVGAAAEVYYGVPLNELTLAQVAMIAGLPKAPSKFNPVANPQRALVRRDYVLGRMRDLGFIDAAAYEQAREAPVTARVHAVPAEVDAPYVAEMVRSELVERYGEEAYTRGFQVYTTVDSRLQQAADLALRQALLAYDRRHGWRGAEARLELDTTSASERLGTLVTRGEVGGLKPALVLAVEDKSARLLLADGQTLGLGWEAMKWARAYKDENERGRAPASASDIFQPGDLVRLQLGEKGWQLAQIPDVQGALVALRPRDGAILALVGGFDFYDSKFNRVTQAERQPGSGFKPFLYSAALEKGYTPATLINDAPIVLEDASLEGDWRPQNYSRKFYGPTRLREALYKSRNLVSIRLLRDIGIEYTRDYASRFGFKTDKLPKNLSLALGSATVTPMDMVTAFAVFANDGYRVETHLIERIQDAGDEPVYVADFPRVPVPKDESDTSNPAQRVLSEQNVYIMRSMLRDVVRVGTGRKASSLGRKDLAGKTGTTNDQIDAWFNGFNSQLVATAWVGFDQIRPLGRKEVGGTAALPMWVDFARIALDGVPEQTLEVPEGIVTARIDRKTGLRVADGSGRKGTVMEIFREGSLPGEIGAAVGGASPGSAGGGGSSSQGSLF